MQKHTGAHNWYIVNVWASVQKNSNNKRHRYPQDRDKRLSVIHKMGANAYDELLLELLLDEEEEEDEELDEEEEELLELLEDEEELLEDELDAFVVSNQH